MPSTSRDDLRPYRPGEMPTAADFNALIDAAKQSGVPGSRRSFEEQSGLTARGKSGMRRDRSHWYRARMRGSGSGTGTGGLTDSVEPYSCLQVVDATLENGEVVLVVQQPQQGARWFAGNEIYPITASGDGWVKQVTPDSKVMMRVADSVAVQAFDRLRPQDENGFVVEPHDDGLMMAASRVSTGTGSGPLPGLVAVTALVFGSGTSGTSGAGDETEDIQVVTDVQCVGGEIVVTKTWVRVFASTGSGTGS